MGYIWAVYISGMHTAKRRLVTPRQIQAVSLSIIWLVYTGMNKYGLATSIHSFVASKSARTHYALIALSYAIVCILYASKSFRPSAALAGLLVFSYLSLQWCVFLKKPIVALAASAAIFNKTKALFVKTYHSFVNCIAMCIVFFNLQNTALFHAEHYLVKVCSAFCQGPF